RPGRSRRRLRTPRCAAPWPPPPCAASPGRRRPAWSPAGSARHVRPASARPSPARRGRPMAPVRRAWQPPAGWRPSGRPGWSTRRKIGGSEAFGWLHGVRIRAVRVEMSTGMPHCTLKMTPVYLTRTTDLRRSAPQHHSGGGLSSDIETTNQLVAIAEAFVDARLRGTSVPGFPGAIPEDLVVAYRVQDLAIARWPDRVVGWKVGYIAPERRDASGDERLLGPIYAQQVSARAEDAAVPVFVGGFGAIEAECVLRLQADAPPDVLDWTPAATAAVPATLHVGLEIASSPLATINQLGPRVVVSDFGNNNGLVLGAEIVDWRSIPEHE